MSQAGSEEELEAALIKLGPWRPSAKEGAEAQTWIDWLDGVRAFLLGLGRLNIISVGMILENLLHQRKFGAARPITRATPETVSIHRAAPSLVFITRNGL